MKTRYNLNQVTRRFTDFENRKPIDSKQPDCSTTVEANFRVESAFKDLENRIIEKIEHADAVVGCVAWLTSEKILEALAKARYGVSIIIQKEEFLRPDLGQDKTHSVKIRALYERLRGIFGPTELGLERRSKEIWQMSEGSVDLSIRCVGYAKDQSEVTLPRMHHKFLVFCKYLESDEPWSYVPYAVWTGSFNMTKNGTYSLENALYVENAEIAESFFNEWFNVLLLSEELNWENEYCKPDIQLNDLTLWS